MKCRVQSYPLKPGWRWGYLLLRRVIKQRLWWTRTSNQSSKSGATKTAQLERSRCNWTNCKEVIRASSRMNSSNRMIENRASSRKLKRLPCSQMKGSSYKTWRNLCTGRNSLRLVSKNLPRMRWARSGKPRRSRRNWAMTPRWQPPKRNRWQRRLKYHCKRYRCSNIKWR